MSNGRDDGDGADQRQNERLQLVESKINLERAAEIGVTLAGLSPKDMSQIFDFAKGMSLADSMVPHFCRGKPWTCFGICLQAIEWKMSPFSLARMAYEVENQRTHEKTVSYMSQLFHAVLESRGVLVERLRVRYEPEGPPTDETVCIVSGQFKNEKEPREWRSPKLGERRPKPQKRTDRRTGEEYETQPGSPLWQSKPLVQLYYDTSRDWVRIYCPDVTMGIYGEDEMDEVGFTPTSPPPSDDGGLSRRLSEAALRSAGFTPRFAAAAIDGEGAAPDTTDRSAQGVAPEPGLGDGVSPAPPSPLIPDAPPPDEAGQPLAMDEAAATPIAETEESRPRGSQRRPRPARTAGDEGRLV